MAAGYVGISWFFFFLLLVIFKFALLSFVNLPRFINFIELFKELPLCFIDFLYFIVLFSLISVRIFFIFFLLHTFALFCSTLCSFLR